MRTSLFSLAGAALVALCCIDPNRAAGEAPASSAVINEIPSPPAPPAPPSPPVPPLPPPVLNIDFPGGSLAEFAATVRQRAGVPLNLVGEPSALAKSLPPIVLQNADVDAAMAALNDLVQSKGLAVQRKYGQQSPVFVLQQMPTPSSGPTLLNCYSLRGLPESISVDDVVDAIRAAWAINPDNKPELLRIQFHPGTRLLIVNGPPDAVMAASQVMHALAPTHSVAEKN